MKSRATNFFFAGVSKFEKVVVVILSTLIFISAFLSELPLALAAIAYNNGGPVRLRFARHKGFVPVGRPR
jgi:hypothetical protein